MSERELRRSISVLPIRTVITLTGLSARQIRYYESQGLILPDRSTSNHRLYSLDNIDRLLLIKDYLDSGMTIDNIKEMEQKNRSEEKLSDSAARKLLKSELMRSGGLTPHSRLLH